MTSALAVHRPSIPLAVHRLLPGLALAGALACAAMAAGRIAWLQVHGPGALTLAIVFGLLVGNTLPAGIAAAAGAGVGFSKQTLLRLGVVLYGLRLTTRDISHVGLAGVAIDALVLASTFGLASWIGTRWLGLEREAAMLIGAGSAICGAAAVMATGPVVKARAEQVTVAVATVVVFGTLATFVYPLLFTLSRHAGPFAVGADRFGVYAGSTIHEVAQVVAAGRSIGACAADSAVIAKMVRVMMLAPFLVGLSAWLARGRRGEGQRPVAAGKPAVPWFAFGFVGVVLLNSLDCLPAPVVAAATACDAVFLATAMAALGLATHLGAIRRAGARPLLLAAILFAWLVLGGAAINLGVGAIFGGRTPGFAWRNAASDTAAASPAVGSEMTRPSPAYRR